ncbi:MAG: PAS domain S-box protein, partial [Acidobacteria bacterium]|nr:PAS domain S-box protein [Acidobacteriota bacterium]
MNVVFVSDDSSSVKLLKSELNKHIRASQDKLSPDEKNSPADLGQVIVEQVGVTPDGLLQLPDAESFQGDVVVLDCAVTGKRTEQVISDTTHRAPGVPVILLTDPADETVEVDAINAGATDCIAKTDKYLNRLLPIIERELQRRKRTHEKSDSSSREDRLRQVVEKLPVGVAVIAPEGTFLAINQAGLKNLGAAKLDQIVGKKIQHLVEKKDHYRSLAFLTTVSGGKDDSLYLRWKGLNGKETGIQLHATPMRRQGIKGAAVLAAIYTPGEPDETQNSKKEAKEGTDLKKALQELKGQFQGLQKNHSLQKSKWEAAMQQLENKSLEWEQKARETEKQQAELKTALDESEKNRKQQAEEYEAERARWEEIRREWEQNNSETQEQQTGMQSTLREAGEQLSAIEAALQEKEELRAAMETALQEAAEKSTALEAALQEEKEQRAAMETSLKEAEEK